MKLQDNDFDPPEQKKSCALCERDDCILCWPDDGSNAPWHYMDRCTHEHFQRHGNEPCGYSEVAPTLADCEGHDFGYQPR